MASEESSIVFPGFDGSTWFYQPFVILHCSQLNVCWFVPFLALTSLFLFFFFCWQTEQTKEKNKTFCVCLSDQFVLFIFAQKNVSNCAFTKKCFLCDVFLLVRGQILKVQNYQAACIEIFQAGTAIGCHMVSGGKPFPKREENTGTFCLGCSVLSPPAWALQPTSWHQFFPETGGEL